MKDLFKKNTFVEINILPSFVVLKKPHDKVSIVHDGVGQIHGIVPAAATEHVCCAKGVCCYCNSSNCPCGCERDTASETSVRTKTMETRTGANTVIRMTVPYRDKSLN